MTPAGGSRDDPPGGAGPGRRAEPGRSGDAAGPRGAAAEPLLPALREPPEGSEDGDTGLQAMRSVWRSMRDEEPSDRGMAALLAAARTRAEAMRPRPSRWQWLLAALRRPAVLALASALVVVGGAVLIGRRSAEAPARSQAIEPVAEPPATPPPTAAPAAAPAAAPRFPEHRAPEPQALRPAPLPPADLGRGRASDPHASPKAAPASSAASAPLRHIEPEMWAPAGKTAPLAPQCLAAARRGDCAAARRLVQQIRLAEPESLERVTRDQAVDRCLSE